MQNYRIYFDGSERDEVLRILGKYNDIIIDSVDEHSVGITIERDDEGAFYRDLRSEIDKEIFSMRTDSGI